MSRLTITVFGSGHCHPGTPPYETARELGRAIAAAGWTLCNGGYGGTMEAAARGATEVGGHTIGVTCVLFRDRGGANAYVREEIRAPDLLARLRVLIERGDGYVVLPGGTGTLTELALVWEMVNKGLVQPRPIVLLGPHWAPVVTAVRAEQPDALDLPVAHTPAEAVARLRAALGA